MILAGATLALTDSLVLLALAAVIGTLSPSGSEVGAFQAVEQAILPQTIESRQRTPVFAWYNLAGSLATALGALCAGAVTQRLQHAGITLLASYRLILGGYGLLGMLLLLLFLRLTGQVEARSQGDTGEQVMVRSRFGLYRSRRVVMRLASLFALDAFAGGLVLQSVIAYWFHLRFAVDLAGLGGIFFGANVLAGLSALAAGRLASRIGLINTMVWTHIPSNVLLMAVPLMPNLPLAVGVLLARFSISQMDVPTRQSYVMAVVDPDERSAAAGVTSIVRTAASAVAPTLTGFLLGTGWIAAPFFLAGALKIAYDLTLYHSFRCIRPPEEQ
jgi:MFS family permease